MTNETTYSILEDSKSEYHKLSIQVSLNGLSFCVLDTLSNTVIASEKIKFENELTPYAVQKEIKQLFDKNEIQKIQFSEVVVIHRNNLFCLVPKALFNKDELANYLKFNAKILANDHLEYDEIDNLEMVNVYVPFVNINNYIYDLFGDFDFMHNGTVQIKSLINSHGNTNEPICYVHLIEGHMDITIIQNKKLLLYNNFRFTANEDFIYYLLFTLEQLKLDTATTKLKLFGAIEEDDALYQLCHTYIQNISIFVPSTTTLYHFGELEQESIDFTLLNSH
ncbi:DUF3822 domain-containing protein [Arenibacter sp. H213]|uniref:DUF3822 family protein n=1 Tax=Arenibacter antarcticus TaxID=2040469 RepID=A0ABW5VHY5_9FLAO|nr:DUF3822 family protein [Arenibacter sp. H213]MCM4168893.1 DUF3822 domain-containing protein [Arenibacter sp. H213]